MLDHTNATLARSHHQKGPGKRILLIDDEDVITFGFKKVLEEPGVAVDCARTPGEARVYILAHHYDAAVVDLRLSYSTGIEGFECVRLLKEDRNACTIIMLTAYSDPNLKEHAREIGVDLFLEKPIEPQTVKGAFKSLGVYGLARKGNQGAAIATNA